MKLPLVGQTYSPRSTAASAATSINVYAERIQDPNIPPQGNVLSAGNPLVGKNLGTLYGCPGRHLFSNLTAIDAAAHPIRGIWSGGGRLFAAAGTKYMELSSTGTLIGSVRTIADDASHSPVQMLVNGNQLFIVSAGLAYIDNGAGPTLISFTSATYTDLAIGYSGTVNNSVPYADLAIGYSGTVTTNGLLVLLASGAPFNDGMAGQNIVIAGAGTFTVDVVVNPGELLLTATAGIHIGVAYVQGVNTTVNSPSQPFTADDIGDSLSVTSGTGFTVQTVTIEAVVPYGNATCSAALGTLGSTAGVGSKFFPYGVLWVSGAQFNASMEGQSIIIAGGIGTFTVGSVLSPTFLTLTTAAAAYGPTKYTAGPTTEVNSQAQPFKSPDDVGATLAVVAGDGFTLQSVTILSVDQIGNATCSLALGTLGSTGGVANETFAFSAVTGTYLDTYFIVNPVNSSQFQISAILNGSSWQSSDVGVKESYPDHVRCVVAHNEQLYVFGYQTLEVWQNTGGGLNAQGVAQFPFQRIDGAGAKFGSLSAWGPIALAGQLFFLGTNQEGQISAYVLDGLTPKRISTHAEEYQWNNSGFLGLPTSAISYGYTEEGHSFWVFTIGQQTWHFDTTTGGWGTRAAWNGATYTIYPTNYHAYVAEFGPGDGKHITGGMQDGILYESSVNFYDDNGLDIKWQRALPYLYNDGKQLYLGRAELDMETGTAPAGAPVITLDWSHDRGKTFVNGETASIGLAGQNSQRVYWVNNGSTRGAVPRLSGVGQYKVALVDLD